MNTDSMKMEAKTIPWGQRRGEDYYKRMIIPATWIGQSDKVVGGKYYKVMLKD